MRLSIALSIVMMIGVANGCTSRGSTKPAANAQTQPRAHEPPATAPSSNSPPLENQPVTEITSSAGTYLVLISPQLEKFPTNEMFSLRVSVLRAGDRKPEAGELDLAVDAAMPAHHHGMNVRPKVLRNPDGSFAVRGLRLHMSGQWEMYFDITRNGLTERAQLAVNLP